MNRNIIRGTMALLLILVVCISSAAATDDTVTRDLPDSANAGASITVNLTVDIATSATYYGIDEIVPSGWTVTYSYTVTVPADASGTCAFGGIYSSEVTAETAILGDPSVTIGSAVDTVTRDLPDSANAGASITVNLTVDVVTSATYYGIYSYTVTVPADASGTCAFGGIYSSEVTAETAILGDPSVTVSDGGGPVTLTWQTEPPTSVMQGSSVTFDVSFSAQASYYSCIEDSTGGVVWRYPTSGTGTTADPHPRTWTTTSATPGDYTIVININGDDNANTRTVTVTAAVPQNIVAIGDVTLEHGATTDVPIQLVNSTGVGGATVTLTFNPSIVNTTNMVAGDFDSVFTPDYSDVGTGTLRITCTELGTDLTGDLTIATVTFDAVGTSGSCALGLSADLTDKSEAAVTSAVNNGTFTISVAEDTTAPTITSVTLSPTNAVPGGSVTVTVVATDASGIASVTANGTTGTTTLASQGSNTWQGTITAPTTDGTYTVTVVATDSSANANTATDTSKSFTVAADATVPTISSVTLSPTSVGPSGSVTVTVVATDASGIASVTANGTTGTTTLTSMGSNEWQGTITAPSTAGTYTVTVVATDASPNANTATDTSKSFTVCTDSCTITLSTTGYTLIAMPLNDPGISTASDLANRIVGCNEVVKYDETTGAFVSYVAGSPLNDFAIVKGRGYFVNGATVSSVTFYGSIWT